MGLIHQNLISILQTLTPMVTPSCTSRTSMSNVLLFVFNQRNFLPDKHVAKVDGRVSELVSLGATGDRKINQDGLAMFKLRTSFCKPKKSVVKLSYKLSIHEKDLEEVVPSYKKSEVKSKGTGAVIGNGIGLFTTISSFRTPMIFLELELINV
ncbi:hypothetical protein RND81_03G080600 [Saponaria officinalis]|uniref:Uncharacterized protein n=1 Tax=Saponaria officinalis TaxID=3572 RepID=A0AAW1M8R9_SAPOF